MESTTISFLFFSFVFLGTTTAKKHITAIFAFGDSILDPGNNNALNTISRANHLPYGEDFPGHVSTGRFSNGKLTTDFLVSNLGIKKLLPAYLDPNLTDHELLSGASFASGGSGLDPITARDDNVLSRSTQLSYFEQALVRIRKVSGKSEARRIVKSALFLIASGTNDMMVNYYILPLRKNMSLSHYQDFLLGELEKSIRRLYHSGARRIAVAGLPPIGCLPVQVSLGNLIPPNMGKSQCIYNQNADSRAYNKKLQAITSHLSRKLSRSRIIYVDIYNPLINMIKRPAEYGFSRTHVHSGCCGEGILEIGLFCNQISPICSDRSKYIFWDAIHPTQATYSKIADHIQHSVLHRIIE